MNADIHTPSPSLANPSPSKRPRLPGKPDQTPTKPLNAQLPMLNLAVPHGAKALKSEIDDSILDNIPTYTGRTQIVTVPTTDSEKIVDLRRAGAGWEEIALELNRARRAANQVPAAVYTPEMVYARYVLHLPFAPKVRAEGEQDDFMTTYELPHNEEAEKKKTGKKPGPPKEEKLARPAGPDNFTRRQDELLVEAVQEVNVGFWDKVAWQVEARGGVGFSGEQCAKQFEGI